MFAYDADDFTIAVMMSGNGLTRDFDAFEGSRRMAVRPLVVEAEIAGVASFVQPISLAKRLKTQSQEEEWHHREIDPRGRLSLQYVLYRRYVR